MRRRHLFCEYMTHSAMKRAAASLTIYFVLCCSSASALIVPGARYFGVRRGGGMAELRKRVGQSVSSSSSSVEQSGPSGVGSLFWKHHAGKGIGEERVSRGASGAGRDPPRPNSGCASSSIIHLGKLRIPQTRRINLMTGRASADSSAEPAVTDRPPSLKPLGYKGREVEQEEPQEEEEEERGEGERLIEVDGNRVVLAPAFAGGPSVIPFGVGETNIESGVVQIPLRYTVGQAVKFIRTVATVDRDYQRNAPVAAGPAAEKMVEKAKEDGVMPRGSKDGLQATLSSRIYVTERGTLKGYITMAALLTHQPETPINDIVRELEEMLKEGDSWEDAAYRLRQANVMAAPVVDSEGVLVAVLNPADLLQEMEIEATDDIMRQSGSGGGESYFGTPLTRIVISRVGWLVSLLCLQSLSSLILQNFRDVMEKNIVIALFLTMLTGTAGNAGNQSSAIVIRGLATGEINRSNRWRVIWREARAAMASAAVLSATSFVRVLLTPGATTVATLAVSIAMGATVIGAVMFGTIAPIVLDGMGVDPVNFASPALATLTDVSGVFILCSVAKIMLGSGL